MPMKSVLDIEINGAAFADYKAAFDKYESAVKRLPAAWTEVGKSVSKTTKTFGEMVAGFAAANQHAKQVAAAQKEADRLTKSQADHWRDISRHTKDFAANIAGATANLIKWVGPIGVLTGLLGAGVGLFGLERLAASASGQRRSAMGLGVGYGQQAAFGLNYGRFVDTQSLLGGVSGSLYNATSPGYAGLLAAGIPQQYLNSHNAAEVSGELLRRLPDLMKGTPRNLIGYRLSALHLDNVISSEDAVRYLNAPREERAAQQLAYGSDVGALGLNTEQQRAWQDFQTAMERAGAKIENVFISGLSLLAPVLSKLSEAFEKTVAAFLLSPAVGEAIKTFADYLGSPQVLADIKSFADGVAYAARQLAAAARWLGLLPGGDSVASSVASETGQLIPHGMLSTVSPKWGGKQLANYSGVQGATNAQWFKDNGLSIPSWFSSGAAGDPPASSAREALIRSYAASIGIDPNVAMYYARREGFGGKVGDHGTSFGDFQLHYNAQGNGVGDQYTAATGHWAGDQSNWPEQDKYALDFARSHGWGAWSSNAGRDPYEGMNRSARVVIQDNTGGNVGITTTQGASGF
jgi:hypothetical protein